VNSTPTQWRRPLVFCRRSADRGLLPVQILVFGIGHRLRDFYSEPYRGQILVSRHPMRRSNSTGRGSERSKAPIPVISPHSVSIVLTYPRIVLGNVGPACDEFTPRDSPTRDYGYVYISLDDVGNRFAAAHAHRRWSVIPSYPRHQAKSSPRIRPINQVKDNGSDHQLTNLQSCAR